MKQLTIDTGVQEFEINGSGVLRFNPSDPNVAIGRASWRERE